MTHKGIIFHQINLHRSKFSNFELFKQLESLDNFIVLAQEPHVHKSKITGAPRGLKSKLSCPDSRSCILHPSSMNVAVVGELCSRDITACIWETTSTNHPKIMLISAYWDITLLGIPVKLLSCLDYCSSHNIPYVCSMDSNAHSTLWGCKQDNLRGKILEELILGAGADLLNLGTKPTFTNHRSATIIDITFIDPTLSDTCFGWRHHDSPSLSDHVALRFNLDLTIAPPPLVRVWKNADWPLFKSLLQDWSPLPTLWDEASIESQCKTLHDKINSALDLSCPKILPNPKHKLPW